MTTGNQLTNYTHVYKLYSYIIVLTHSVLYVFLGNSQTLFEDYRPISVAVVLIMIMSSL